MILLSPFMQDELNLQATGCSNSLKNFARQTERK